ncbi:MAG: biotin--[acetyl-CoA-carboxylase] ligase [Firmicutes bacterium]|nr:biotin--[acetyl-CoA-carboxylase] ligase [Bacillota bacterium]
MRQALIKQFLAAEGRYVSGAELASRLGVSRNAVWKQVESLRDLGYSIEAVPRKGYRLVERPDRLYPWELGAVLTTERFGRHIEYHESIGSTNERAKALGVAGKPEGCIVVAEEQTAGRGRLGRSWISPFAEGLFVSLLLRPPFRPWEAPKLTLLSAVAVQRAISEVCGLESKIKWPNDLELRGKKVCGILVEMGMEMDAVSYVVVGIGINANLRVDVLPDDVRERATSLRHELGRPVDRVALLASLLSYFERLYDQALGDGFRTVLELNRRLSSTLGRRIRVLTARDEWEGVAVDIDHNGALLVRRDDGSVQAVHSGEVSIRA